MISLDSLNSFEKERLENSIKLILSLFSRSRRKEVIDIILGDTINELVIKKSGVGEEEGLIYEGDNGKYTVEYEEYDVTNPIKSLHQSIHELLHILGVPNKKLTQGKDFNGGLEITILNEQTHKWEYYGKIINEATDEILSKIALSNIKGDVINYNADDVIMSNDILFTSKYKIVIPIARLLAFAMNNEFYREYYELIDQEEGLVDARTTFKTNNSRISLPVNDLFYGMVINPLYSEKRYDMYSKKDEYRRINEELDNAFNNKKIDISLIKDIMISISDMFNNKIYHYFINGMISKETYKRCSKKYDELLDTICEYYRNMYDVKIEFDNNDNFRMFESVYKTRLAQGQTFDGETM